jgi:hypothetical protein
MDTFKTLVEMRDKESIQFGKVTVDLLKDNTNILWMTRKAEGFPGYIVIINFGDSPFASSFKEAKLPNEITQVFHSDGNVYEGTMDLNNTRSLKFRYHFIGSVHLTCDNTPIILFI